MTLMIVTLAGWPGVLLGLMIGIEVLERAFTRPSPVAGQYKILVALVILGIGLLSTSRNLAPPRITRPSWQDQAATVDPAIRRAVEQTALEERVKALKRDLAAQR
jgi:hypothetical protein